MSDDVQIPLSNAIRALRAEIVSAVRAGHDEEIRFALGPIELEMQVESAHDAGADFGIRFWLVSIGAKGARTSAATHTVKLTLTPVRASPDDPENRDVLVSSDVELRG